MSYMGWKRYLNVAVEDVWGTKNGSPAYVQVPFDTYDCKVVPTSRQATPFSGIRQRLHNEITRRIVQGQLACSLFGHQNSNVSLAQYLIAWLLSGPASTDLDSKTIELYEDDTDNKRHLGMRPASGVIAGSADSGICNISLQLMGKSESGGITPPSLAPTVVPERSEFLFKDTTFSLGGSPVTIANFSINVNNNLVPDYLNDVDPTSIDAGDRIIDYTITVRKTDDTFDALRRLTGSNETTGSLVLKGRHNGTGASGNYTTVTFAFDRLSFQDAGEDAGDRNRRVSQSPQYVVLRPVSADNDVDVTYGNAA